MHFSIPDTQDFVNENSGSSFTGFNIHINGTFHCCLRYKQLHSLHEQLKRSLSTLVLPTFPPKKFFPLTPSQLEDRRSSLERYIQLVGQDPVLSKSELLRTFLLSAQTESSYTESQETTLDVYLMNGFRIAVNAYTTECSTKVLEKACDNIDLPREYAYYFALFLMRKENDGSVTLTRKLLDFEAPFITQRIHHECKIVIRKNYWDPCYDLELMRDSIALNLLFIQTLSDIERGWILTTKEARDQLTKLQSHGNKKEFLEIARNLPSYGVVLFSRAIVDYPDENTQTTITIGNKELCTRVMVGKKVQEAKFKVTRMRCWRVTTIHNNDISSESMNSRHKWELSFEYLMSKNCLKWITVASEQAMLMSVCLQSMVDELLNQKTGADVNNMQVHRTNYTPLCYIRRDGSSGMISNSSSSDTISSLNEMDIGNRGGSRMDTSSVRRKIKEKISTTVFFRSGRESVHNEAFEGIGDDDL